MRPCDQCGKLMPAGPAPYVLLMQNPFTVVGVCSLDCLYIWLSDYEEEHDEKG
jgi:hypothetical protein